MRRSTLFTAAMLVVMRAAFSQGIQQHEHCRTHYPTNVFGFERWLHSHEKVGIASDEVYQIPVVIHILHQGEEVGEGTNLSDARIASQLRVLNEDYRRMTGTRGFNNHPDGGDTRIEFVLATIDPDGYSTTGVNRVNVTGKDMPPGLGNTLLMSAYFSQWNPEQYLNIWSFPWLPENTLLGEARFPVSDLPGLEEENQIGWTLPGIGEVDGVAVNAHHFGETGSTGVYSLGRTLTHEIGHFLGLFHIWGPNDLDRDGCELDDFCEDTPPTRGRVSGCPTGLLACNGEPAMIENYMDYADDACMNVFTNDQISRMRAVLENSPRRKSLLTSPALRPALEVPTDLNSVISVYPNPASDRLYISFKDHRLENIQLEIRDMNGKSLLCQEYSRSFDEQIEVQLPPRSGQMLLLTLRSAGAVFRQKVLIQ